eukprot:1629089-Lingulodinium_polyedra.AAC.1
MASSKAAAYHRDCASLARNLNLSAAALPFVRLGLCSAGVREARIASESRGRSWSSDCAALAFVSLELCSARVREAWIF